MSHNASIRREMQQLLDQYLVCIDSGELERCTESYTVDGAIYSPYGPAAIGRDAIRNTHRAWLDAGETNKQIIVQEARSEGDLAYCIASYSGDYRQEDGTMFTERGTSLNIAKRQPDGSWQLHISSLNSDSPA
jgi:uncharacterized protein (TIGR02246 family)